MSELDYRFTGASGVPLRVALGAAGDPQLYRWADKAWRENVPLYDSAYEVLRELARLATARNEGAAKSEQLPDGSREFSTNSGRWRVSLVGGDPGLCMAGADSDAVDLWAPHAPHPHVLAREFAALGREQGFAQKIDALEESTRERIAELEARLAGKSENSTPLPAVDARFEEVFNHDGARWMAQIQGAAMRLFRRDTFGCWVTESFGELPPELLVVKFAAAAKNRGVAEESARYRQRELDSRAEVASLLEALEEQKARADGLFGQILEYGGRTAQDFEIEARDLRRTRQEAYALLGAERRRHADLESRDAERFEDFAAGMIAASKARAEGDPRRFVSFVARKYAWSAVAADGSAWITRGDGRGWQQVGTLPPIEPEPAIEANRPEPESGERSHSWGFDSVEKCDDCGITRSGRAGSAACPGPREGADV